MIRFLIDNAATIIISVFLVLLAAKIAISTVRNAGKCAGCASCSAHCSEKPSDTAG